MKSIVFIWLVVFVSSKLVLGQNNTMPNLPRPPQPATFQKYNTSNYTATNKPTNNIPTATLLPTSTSVYNNRQTLNRQQQLEEKDIKESFAPKKRTETDADLDTTFGNPPVLSYEKYQETKPF